jgi:hypothetical protein
MAAPRVEEYVTQAFQGTQVTVEVVKGQATFEAEYPCLAAVNRYARFSDITYVPVPLFKGTGTVRRDGSWIHLKVVPMSQ